MNYSKVECVVLGQGREVNRPSYHNRLDLVKGLKLVIYQNSGQLVETLQIEMSCEANYSFALYPPIFSRDTDPGHSISVPPSSDIILYLVSKIADA